jgi:hypothetical protein
LVSSLALLISITATKANSDVGEAAHHPILCAGHIRSLIVCRDAHRAYQVGRRYTGFQSKKKDHHLRHHDAALNNGDRDAATAPVVWLAFMDACADADLGIELERIWKAARAGVRLVEGQEHDQDVERVWMWGLEKITDDNTMKSVIEVSHD